MVAGGGGAGGRRDLGCVLGLVVFLPALADDEQLCNIFIPLGPGSAPSPATGKARCSPYPPCSLRLQSPPPVHVPLQPCTIPFTRALASHTDE